VIKLLVLARKKNESILIGEDIEIIVSEISDDKVKLAIKAPKSMKIFRKELILEIEQENKKSAESDNVDIEKITLAIKNKL
jgi:carbon storage regulator